MQRGCIFKLVGIGPFDWRCLRVGQQQCGTLKLLAFHWIPRIFDEDSIQVSIPSSVWIICFMNFDELRLVSSRAQIRLKSPGAQTRVMGSQTGARPPRASSSAVFFRSTKRPVWITQSLPLSFLILKVQVWRVENASVKGTGVSLFFRTNCRTRAPRIDRLAHWPLQDLAKRVVTSRARVDDFFCRNNAAIRDVS